MSSAPARPTRRSTRCATRWKKELTEKGEEPLHREGYRGGTWVLLDYGCVVVHVFNDEARKFYSLEHLWADGEEVDLSAPAHADGKINA